MHKCSPFAILLFGLIYCVSADVTIKELRVPEVIEVGSEVPVILDCDYEIYNETGVEVKWFFNGDSEQIYVWVPKLLDPHGLGPFKDRFDLNYRASEDEYTMYRALYIKEISPSLSGNYTCKVSGFDHEATETKQMIVYDPPDLFNLIHIEESQSLVCFAYGVFPKPVVTITVSYIDRNDTIYDTDTKELYEKGGGVYNVTQIMNYERQSLEAPVEFVCELTIPGTNYTWLRKLDYLTDLTASSEQSENATLTETNFHADNRSISTNTKKSATPDIAGIQSAPTKWLMLLTTCTTILFRLRTVL